MQSLHHYSTRRNCALCSYLIGLRWLRGESLVFSLCTFSQRRQVEGVDLGDERSQTAVCALWCIRRPQMAVVVREKIQNEPMCEAQPGFSLPVSWPPSHSTKPPKPHRLQQRTPHRLAWRCSYIYPAGAESRCLVESERRGTLCKNPRDKDLSALFSATSLSSRHRRVLTTCSGGRGRCVRPLAARPALWMSQGFIR